MQGESTFNASTRLLIAPMKRVHKPGKLNLPKLTQPDPLISHDGVFASDDVKIGAKGMQIDSAKRRPGPNSEGKDYDSEHKECIDEYVDIVQSDLEILSVLGAGSSGAVKKVRHKRSGKLMALKVVPLEVTQAKRQQILLELRTLHSAECPHIVDFYGAFMQDGVISMALEYMEGGSLHDVVAESGPIDEKIISKIAKQVLLGLHYLHKTKHIVHRDLKPQNLLVSRTGHTKVADFGMSGEMENSLDMKVSFVGTASYMSPERMLGHEYSFASDVWSFGLSMMECALGRYPYPPPGSGVEIANFWDLLDFIQHEDPPVMDAERFSPEFCDFVHSCVRKDVSERPLTPALLEHPFLSLYDDEDIDTEQWLLSAVPTLDLEY